MVDNPITPCPATPNCVSSIEASPSKRLDPIPFSGDISRAKSRLKRVVEAMKGARIVEERDEYFRAIFRSNVFRFIDDVEFWLDEQNKVIHFKSASRTGYYDFGVNKKRMVTIRSAFLAENQ